MPAAKLKPSEVASEAKRIYVPYIKQKYGDKWPAYSYLVADSSLVKCQPQDDFRLRVAVIEGDPVDVALDWCQDNRKSATDGETARPIPIINMANDKTAGGDWESGIMAPEENLARRSNLVATLVTPGPGGYSSANYPIPQKGGIYSPHVGR